MKVRIAGVVAGLMVTGALGLAAVRSYPSPEKELTAACARFHEAFNSKNAQAVSALLTPDFEEVRLGGAVRKRPEAIVSYQRLFQDWLSFDRHTFEIDTMTIKGSQALIRGNQVVSGRMTDSTGALGEKGKTHKVIADTLEQDLWIQTEQGWKLKNRHTVLGKMTVDGKLIEGHGQAHHDHTEYPEHAVR